MKKVKNGQTTTQAKKKPRAEKRLMYLGPNINEDLLILKHGAILKKLPSKIDQLNERYTLENEKEGEQIEFKDLFVEVKEYEREMERIKKGISKEKILLIKKIEEVKK